ncbi:MAG: hypothetical protein ACMUHX_08210 [bacterium]
MRKFALCIVISVFVIAAISLGVNAKSIGEVFFEGFETGTQIGTDGGLKNTPFGMIPFPTVNLYNFSGWKYEMVKSSENLITGINPILPENWPHDYSTAPMSDRILAADGMIGMANVENNRFAHIGGPLIPLFSPNEKISISKNFEINKSSRFLVIEFDYLARTLDGILGEEGDNDKVYAQIELLNQVSRKTKKITIWEWSCGDPGMADPNTGMLYSDTDGGFAPFGRLVGDDPMNPANYEPVSFSHYSETIRLPKRNMAEKAILTFGLITDSDPWPTCVLIDNVSIEEMH